jgi:hypothetical protein
MERPNPIAANAQRLLANFVLTEIELRLTFLDVAETTQNRHRARQNVNNALKAQRNADKYLSQILPGTFNLNAARERREQLPERSRMISSGNELS